jgi:hypothetical protein
MRTRTAVALVLAGLLSGAQAQAVGGISVSPLRITAKPVDGVLGTLRVGNSSPRAVVVTITARRWQQQANGQIAPDNSRAGVVSAITASKRQFTLAPGESQTVQLALTGKPRPYLYAALVTRATPMNQGQGGLRLAQEIVSAIRLSPPPSLQRVALKVAAPVVRRSQTGAAVVSVPVRNAGNTITQVSGLIVVRGPGGIRNLTLGPQKLIPGGRVELTAALPAKLSAGRYTVSAWVGRTSTKLTATRAHTGYFGVTRSGQITG